MRRLVAVLIVALLGLAGLMAAGQPLAHPASAPTPVPAPSAVGAHPSVGAIAPAHAGVRSVAPPAGPARGRVALTGPLARFPPPLPPSPSTPSYYGHYYVGTVYNGANFTSTQLSSTIQIPDDVAQSSDFYYVILSVWDDAASYDQIGFANSNGVFGVAYSTTSTCAGYYYYSPDAYALTPGVSYNFSMVIFQGSVTFTVSYLNGTTVWSLVQSTGGTKFIDSAFYTCYYAPYYTNITSYDYTDYEEVYQTAGNLPPYDFFFGQNLADSQGVTGFGLFETYPPGPVTVPINGDNAVIANEAFSLYLNQPNSTYALESPTTSKKFTVQLGVADVSSSGTVNLGTYYQYTGWSVSFNRSSGLPPFTYSAQVTVPAAAPVGNYTVGFHGNDSNGNPNQMSVWFDVVPPLSVAVHVGPHSVADLGQNVSITAVPGGGIGGLLYAWSGLPPGCAGSTQTIRCQPSMTGTFLVTVNATDSSGDVGTSPVFTFAVNPDPIVTVVASPSRVDVNQSVQWYASAMSGSGGFSYTWPNIFAGCKAVGPIATCTPTAAGPYSLSAVATDAAAFSVTSAPATAQVFASPRVSLVLSTYTVDVHQPVQLTAMASGGAGGFVYAWTGLPGGCSSTAPTATCAFSSSGTFLVTVSAFDSFNVGTPVARAYVTVASDPLVQLIASTPSVDLGQTAKFDVRVTGGAPGYGYAFHGLPAGCVTSNVASLSCVPSSVSQTSNLSVAVTDRNNWTVTSAINFTVYTDPVASLVVSPSPVSLGDSVQFVASATGGAPGAAYAWANLPGGCQAAPTATISCAPAQTGAVTVTVTVTDGDGYSANATAVLSVNAAPSVLAGPFPYVLVGVAVAALAVGVILLARRRRAEPPAVE